MVIKTEQVEIIEKLIKNKFDIENFKNFTARVLNIRVGNRKESEAVWKEYQEYIEAYTTVSDYNDKDDRKVYIIAVKIKDYYEKDGKKVPIDLTRARTKQRNFVAKMLKEYRRDGALVAFYNDSRNDWRLSFVKLDYSFTMEGVQEKLTPSKRLSYIVGEGEASHTVIKQFSQLIGNENEISLERFEGLFQLKKVTDEFFECYKNKYLDLKLHLESDEEFIKEALKHSPKVEFFSEEFAKKLMGQLAFLYFLQKKGWLGVKIVPQLISFDDFKKIYGKSSQQGKELLDKVFTRVSQENYKLNAEVNSPDLDKDLLANCFKGSKFDEEWGSGEQKFIRTLFNRHLEINKKRKESGKEENNFFDDYLEHFFYEALNDNRGENQYYPRFNCKIPFLNGGLFEPYDNYDWRNTNFHIPDSIFSNRTEDFEGDGILDVFDRFNFTIAENEPFETEVAVDPEMLGKVFENLLDVKDRKSKGAFYTPREIVHYMCKESLINYLSNEIEELKREDIEQLMQMGEFTKDYDTHIFEMDYKQGKEVKPESWGMPIAVLKNVEKIDSALRNVKVADPAIGSGAFPLGMLNEIVKARSILTEYMLMHEYFLLEKKNEKHKYWDFEDKIRKARALYNLKIDTIENSLFGVDIEPSAVEIAKLRLWLSIVVDSQNDNINPLPNLDFNFMVGNSLLDEFEGIKLFDEKLLDKEYSKTEKLTQSKLFYSGFEEQQRDILGNIKALYKNFFIEKDNKKKKEIKKQINDYEWNLIQFTLRESGNESKIKELEKMQKDKRKPYFLWKLEFAEVFKEKGGFDIVIGNPPYVGEKGHKEIFRPIAESSLGKRFYQGKVDLFYFFFHLGIDVLREYGSLSFITTNYFTTATSAKNLRKDFKERTQILRLINFNELKIFESALGQHNLITILEKSKVKNKIAKNIVCSGNCFANAGILNKILYTNDEKCEYFNVYQDNLFEGYQYYIRTENSKENKVKALLDKIRANGTSLVELFNINQGIVSGADKLTVSHISKFNIEEEKGSSIFVLNREEAEKIELQNQKYKEILMDFYKNSDVKRYFSSNFPKYKIIYITKSDKLSDYPLIEGHLLRFKSILENKRETKEGKLPWYSLHWYRRKDIFRKPKIIAPQRSYYNCFAYNEIDWFASADVYFITEKSIVNICLKYVLALLNSKLYFLWLYNRGKRKGEMLELYAKPLEETPIKEISVESQKPFITIVDKIILAKEQNPNADTTDLENQIDEMVYDLYELTEEEKEIVRQYKR